ncbi:MAG TPA: TetR/AcrR family transcriptional regulator [Methanocorpusculum sp.]|nr:TetR/AcrR family transcriptional regulator [Methanocorpusculum sp.]
MMHETNKSDKRYVKAEAKLRNALLELIDRYGYEAVTIKDIAEEAGTGRATFYKHYNTKSELLAAIEQQMKEEISAVISASFPGTGREAALARVIALLTYFENHIRPAQVLFGKNGSVQFQQEVRDILWNGFHLNNKKLSDIERHSRIPTEYLQYLNYTHFLVMQAWIAKDNRESPEELARIMAEITNVSNAWVHEPGYK